MRPTADGRPEHRGAVRVRPADGYEERSARDLTVLEDWLRDSVGRPSPDLGRSGAVCPFTVPALRVGAVDFSLRYDVDGTSADEVRAVTRQALRAFADRPGNAGTASSGVRLECEVVAFPLIGGAHWPVIDTVHADLKDTAVDLGLMLGQFHPACDERAVRNPLFPVARSPYPLFAIRHMAPHDILFLHERRRWFQRYRQRFPAEAAGSLKDRFMRDLAAEASHRFEGTTAVPQPLGGECR